MMTFIGSPTSTPASSSNEPPFSVGLKNATGFVAGLEVELVATLDEELEEPEDPESACEDWSASPFAMAPRSVEGRTIMYLCSR